MSYRAEVALGVEWSAAISARRPHGSSRVSSVLDSLRLSAARPPAPPPPRCSCSTPALPPGRATAAAIAELEALAALPTPAPPPGRATAAALLVFDARRSTLALPPSRAAIAELEASLCCLDDNDDARIGGAPISARVSCCVPPHAQAERPRHSQP